MGCWERYWNNTPQADSPLISLFTERILKENKTIHISSHHSFDLCKTKKNWICLKLFLDKIQVVGGHSIVSKYSEKCKTNERSVVKFYCK